MTATGEDYELLHEAIRRDEGQRVRRLLLGGTNPLLACAGRLPRAFGVIHKATATQRAAAWGAERSLAALVELGVRLDGCGDDNSSPLHFACWFGQIESVKILLAAGADPNARNRLGLTPLGAVAESGKKADDRFRRQARRLLVAAGALEV